MWSSKSINYPDVNNLIFDQNGEGNIISWNQIEFRNSDFKYYIKINNISFMPEAFNRRRSRCNKYSFYSK